MSDDILYSLAPVWRSDCRIMILGSMPGGESLRKQEYYAYKYNAFWKLLASVLNLELDSLCYNERLIQIQQSRIALWDVLHSCYREGSLDARIRKPEFNDLGQLWERSGELTTVFTNGGAAAGYLERYLKQHVAWRVRLNFIKLPSSSPAHAGMSFAGKEQEWRQIAKALCLKV